jgi:hypothetical protein
LFSFVIDDADLRAPDGVVDINPLGIRIFLLDTNVGTSQFCGLKIRPGTILEKKPGNLAQPRYYRRKKPIIEALKHLHQAPWIGPTGQFQRLSQLRPRRVGRLPDQKLLKIFQAHDAEIPTATLPDSDCPGFYLVIAQYQHVRNFRQTCFSYFIA